MNRGYWKVTRATGKFGKQGTVLGMTGLYVAFEGGEGSGKSTIITEVSSLLRDQLGREVIEIGEPHGEYRRWLFSKERPESTRVDVLLFAAGRAELVDTTIRPGVERGAIVMSDRSVWSTMAYQAPVRGYECVTMVNDFALDDVWPDVVIWLDVDPAVGLSRQLGEGDRFGDQDLAKATALREHYRALCESGGRSRWIRIAPGGISETVDMVYGAIAGLVVEQTGGMS